MAIDVRLHGAFREFAGGARGASVDAGSVGEALSLVIEAYPALRERLRDERGALRRHVSVFANSEEMRHLDGERTVLRPGDVVHIIPAVSGG